MVTGIVGEIEAQGFRIKSDFLTGHTVMWRKIYIAIVMAALVIFPVIEMESNEANTLVNQPGSFKSPNQETSTGQASLNQIDCQAPTETAEQAIERQEEEARNVEKGVVGLEIAQGAIEITLGAIRIAAAGTTADVLRREDNIAVSRAALAASGVAETLPPEEILGPIANDDGSARKAKLCVRKTSNRPMDDPFSEWTRGFSNRMKRASPFSGAFWIKTNPTATDDPNSNSMDETGRLLDLLETLLDTNTRVLGLLGMELHPLTSSAALILRQYKHRVSNLNEENVGTSLGSIGSTRFESSVDPEHTIKTFTNELARLKRMRRIYGVLK